MRQDQALTIQSLQKAGIEPSATARLPKRGDLFEIASTLRQMGETIDDCLSGSRSAKVRWADLAIELADALYEINLRAAAAGIDLEPFVDHIHSVRMRQTADRELLGADISLMAAVGAQDHIGRLLGRNDLEVAERAQVDTCANLHRVEIPLRWPQRVALARIEAAADARAGRALAA